MQYTYVHYMYNQTIGYAQKLCMANTRTIAMIVVVLPGIHIMYKI